VTPPGLGGHDVGAAWRDPGLRDWQEMAVNGRF
jgi:hypothetical protein